MQEEVDVSRVQSAAEVPSISQWVVPSADVQEKEGDVRLSLDVPGVVSDGLTVEVRDNVLDVQGVRADRPTVAYRRRFKLPKTVDTQAISASLGEGVLTLALPRKEEAKPRKVAIEVR